MGGLPSCTDLFGKKLKPRVKLRSIDDIVNDRLSGHGVCPVLPARAVAPVSKAGTSTRFAARLKFRGCGTSCTPADHHLSSVPSTTTSIADVYDLKESLGSGEFATVHRAVQRETGLEVAVKVIRTDSRKQVDATSLEYQLSCRLSASASASSSEAPPPAADTFPRTYGSYVTENGVYLVMDYFRGGTLEDFQSRLPRGRLSEAQAKTALHRVLSGIAHMHKLQVAHCDIKPANLMLSKPEDLSTLSIVDLGLARDLCKGRSISDTCGTPDFFAPELVRACRWGSPFGAEVDLWAAGVLLYQCLSGNVPFRGNTTERLLRSILQNRIDFPEPEWAGVSKECKSLILKLLEKDPTKRISARKALKHPWFKPLNKSRSWSVTSLRDKLQSNRLR